jgi:hypothetical protein
MIFVVFIHSTPSCSKQARVLTYVGSGTVENKAKDVRAVGEIMMVEVEAAMQDARACSRCDVRP